MHIRNRCFRRFCGQEHVTGDAPVRNSGIRFDQSSRRHENTARKSVVLRGNQQNDLLCFPRPDSFGQIDFSSRIVEFPGLFSIDENPGAGLQHGDFQTDSFSAPLRGDCNGSPVPCSIESGRVESRHGRQDNEVVVSRLLSSPSHAGPDAGNFEPAPAGSLIRNIFCVCFCTNREKIP